MKKLSLIVLLSFFFACGDSSQKKSKEGSKEAAIQEGIADGKFNDFKHSFVEALWKIEPIWASYVGYHKYDSLLPLPNEDSRKEKMAFVNGMKEELNAYDLNELNKLNQIDYKMIRDALERFQFGIEKFKRFEWDPSQYNLGGAFYQTLNYRKESLEWRLTQLDKKLENVPAYYSEAKKQLKSPTKVHTELAIQQLNGSKSVFEKKLIDSLSHSSLGVLFKEKFIEKSENAVKAINDFISFLENQILPKVANDSSSFRIGKQLFEEKFSHDIHSAYSAEDIFKAAVEAKVELHDNMYRLSEMLWEKYYGDTEKPGNRLKEIQMVIDAVSRTHVARDSFIYAIRQQIPQLEAFVKEHDLLTLDPDKPLVVRETPGYMRGIAGASISAPGPYDKDAETYYNVTPLDNYSEEAAESYLREYNHYVLQILNIHEAIPGHYTQLIYSNKSPSIIKSVFGNGAMIEGWGVYAEKMMLENNYGGSEKEMGLMYYKWNLRTVCNAILDYGVHVNNFSEKEAMQLLRKEAFQEQAEAEGKWRRARLSQVQLSSYFTGYYEIMQLRDTMRVLKGDAFSLKEFHETFLSFGSAPVKYISEIMQDDALKVLE